MFILLFMALGLECSFSNESSSLRINEFLADPISSSLTDEDGETSDWIELFNSSGEAVDLEGYFLTDDPTELTKWSFPAVSIESNNYLLVFASNKNRRPIDGRELHTNFALSSNGEYLALVSPDGVTILSEFGTSTTDYPSQKGGTSYGFFGEPLQIGFLLTPTPEASNATGDGVIGFVEDTSFATRRGIYDAPFSLTISTATPGASIHYTTDGSWPDESTGTLYTGPITVDRAMSVKAMAFRSGYLSTNVDTHTYIIPSAVAAQTSANTQSDYGLPSSWGLQAPYYGMDDNIFRRGNSFPTLEDDLQTVPSFSIAIDAGDMFGRRGIYSNPEEEGISWERKTSLEFVDPSDPTGGNNFQQNCAIRIQGGFFRRFSLSPKKSFRVIFKSQFGTANEPTGGSGSLKFPVFGSDPGIAQEFQTLVFRMEANDGWQWSSAGGQPQYARDEFNRRTHRALGQPAAHGRHVHLYINGVYWGLYNVVERPDASFAESYFEDVAREDWEGQNSGSLINDTTNLDNWNNFRAAAADISTAARVTEKDAAYLKACGFNSDGTRNPTFPIWCDPTSNADYFITNWYAGNSDWPRKNYYGGIDSISPHNGYQYFMWDSEWSLFIRSDIDTNRITNYTGIAGPNAGLQQSAEYRLRFADRVHRALFNEGPLTPDAARARYEEVTADHRSILNPEAARWGNQHDQMRSLSDWQSEYNRIITSWFPFRSSRFLTSLRSAGLYPSLTAPTYSQHGGNLASGTGPNIIAPLTVDQVYYTFGASDSDLSDYAHSLDPRLVGGGINPAAVLAVSGEDPSTSDFVSTPIVIDEPGWLFSRSYDSASGQWSALNTAFFHPDAIPASATNLAISEINYNPEDPTTSSELLVSVNNDDYEFLELMNVSNQFIDLSGVKFTEGILFHFAENTILAPNARLILVKNRAAFDVRYPGLGTTVNIATDVLGRDFYDGRLSNGGERLTLLAADDSLIHDFLYSDVLPWPLADGSGFTLVLKSPAVPIPEHEDPLHWVSSNAAGGAPGSAAEFGFLGEVNSDEDRDAYSALLEYAMGSDDTQFGDAAQQFVVTTQSFTEDLATDDYLVVTYHRNLFSQNAVTLIPQFSNDLVSWDSESEIVFLSETNNLDGTSTVSYRITQPIDESVRVFVRLVAQQ